MFTDFFFFFFFGRKEVTRLGTIIFNIIKRKTYD